jgi:hypothetical protein
VKAELKISIFGPRSILGLVADEVRLLLRLQLATSHLFQHAILPAIASLLSAHHVSRYSSRCYLCWFRSHPQSVVRCSPAPARRNETVFLPAAGPICPTRLWQLKRVHTSGQCYSCCSPTDRTTGLGTTPECRVSFAGRWVR